MKNTFGQSVCLTLFGESHGEAVGAIVDGLAAGIPIDEDAIGKALSLRRPSFSCDTARREKDDFSILSGIFHGYTTGTPLTIVIKNGDTCSAPYEETRGLARPSHADYAAFCKYGGYEDYRGGGHFSGRITAPLVAAGAIFTSILEAKNIRVGTHVLRCGGSSDRAFSIDPLEEILALKDLAFPVLDENAKKEMEEKINRAAACGDSVGGITQTAVCGVPAGLGEPWFDGADGVLAHALYSLGGVKGVSFGEGFSLADETGSTANDEFYTDGNAVYTKTNRSGGINGGLTNGMPIVFSCAVKPTPSIAKPQQTVNFLQKTNATLSLSGRHDPSIVRRITHVINGVTAFVVCDLYAARYGTDALRQGF